MKTRSFLSLSLILLAACLLSVWLVDQPLAFFIDQHLRASRPFFSAITHYGEIATGFPVSRYFPMYVFLALGAIVLCLDRRFARANIFFFIAITFAVSRFAAGVLKPVFERMRPFDLVAHPEFGKTFFLDGGTSFPSGHAAHFWGLFLPLIFLFPQIRFPLMIIPVAICVARVAVNDHYVSDVLGSTLLVLLLTFVFAKLFRISARPTEQPPSQNSTA